MNTKKYLKLFKIILSFIFLLIILVVLFQGIEKLLDKKITIPFIKEIVLTIGQLWEYSPVLFFILFGITISVLYVSGVLPLFIMGVFTVYTYLKLIINHFLKKED